MNRRFFITTLIGATALMFGKWATMKAATPEILDTPIVKWAESNIFVKNLADGKHLIKLTPAQKRVLNSWEDNTKNVLLSCRQFGKSTLAYIHALYTCIHNRNYRYAIISPNAHSAHHSRLIITEMLNDMWVHDKSKNYTSHSYVYEYLNKEIGYLQLINESSILCDYVRPDTLRGWGIDAVNMQEFDFISKTSDEEWWKCVVPVISSRLRSKIIVASSYSDNPNTVFKKLVHDTNFNVQKVDYTEVPNFVGKVEKYKPLLTEKQFNREYLNII